MAGGTFALCSGSLLTALLFLPAYPYARRRPVCTHQPADAAGNSVRNPLCLHTNYLYLMSQYIKDDNVINVSESSTLTVQDTLPAGTYTVELNRRTNTFFLKQMQDFKPIGKVYGNHAATVERIITTFLHRRERNLGVLLSGIKGSGKTLTAKMISVELAKRCGMATLIVNKGYDTAELSGFLRSIDVPCMVLFDEFDKVYSYRDDEDNTSQSGLLDILDGVFESRKLFVMSCNDTHLINPYFFSRPGRIFYHYRYTGLTQNIISLYCDDQLQNPALKSEVLRLSTFVRNMTFDMLQAIVEECNRYNESPLDFIETLNIQYGLSGSYRLELQLPDGTTVAQPRRPVELDFGSASWYLRIDYSERVKPLLEHPDSMFSRDDDEDDIANGEDYLYGYYRPEMRDLLAVAQDGTIRLSVLKNALVAVLHRAPENALLYADLVSKTEPVNA